MGVSFKDLEPSPKCVYVQRFVAPLSWPNTSVDAKLPPDTTLAQKPSELLQESV